MDTVDEGTKKQNRQKINKLKIDLQKDPNMKKTMWELGVAYGTIGEWTHAAIYFEKLVRLKESPKNVYFNLALSLEQQNREQDAIKTLEQAIKNKSDDGQCLNNLGCLYGFRSEWQIALKYLQEANQLLDDLEIDYNNAYVREKIKQENDEKQLKNRIKEEQDISNRMRQESSQDIHPSSSQMKRKIQDHYKKSNKRRPENIRYNDKYNMFYYHKIRESQQIQYNSDHYNLQIQYEYLPNEKRIKELKNQLISNFNITYYLNRDIKLNPMIEKTVVLTSLNHGLNINQDQRSIFKLDFLWNDYEEFQEIRQNMEKSRQLQDTHQMKEYFKQYYQCCQKLKQLLIILNKKRRQAKREQNNDNFESILRKGFFKVKLYMLQIQSPERIQKQNPTSYYFGELTSVRNQANMPIDTFQGTVDQYFIYVSSTQHEENNVDVVDIAKLYLDEDQTFLRNKQKRQFDRNSIYHNVFTISTHIKFQQHPINPDIQSYYNINLKKMKDIQIIRANIKINDQMDFIYRVINKKVDKEKGKVVKKTKKRTIESMFFIEQKREKYNDLDACYLRKGTVIPFRQGRFNREIVFYNKHLSLAFRGGGAKGLAYSGASKALQELRDKYYKKFNEDILIKSVIGTSAGGIFALAVSTGISSRQVQTVFEGMKQVPVKNKIQGAQERQHYENKMEELKQTVINILETYNILDKGFSTKALDFLGEAVDHLNIEFQSVSKKTWNKMLDAVFQTNFFFDKIQEGDLPEIQKKKQSLNFQGLLYHAALCSGSCNAKSAAECLLKYFQKEMDKAHQITEAMEGLSIQERIQENKQKLRWKYISILDEAYKVTEDGRNLRRRQSDNDQFNQQLRDTEDCLDNIGFYLFEKSEQLWNQKKQLRKFTIKQLHQVQIVSQSRRLSGKVFLSIINKVLHHYFSQSNNLQQYIAKFQPKRQGQINEKLLIKNMKQLQSISSNFIFNLAEIDTETHKQNLITISCHDGTIDREKSNQQKLKCFKKLSLWNLIKYIKILSKKEILEESTQEQNTIFQGTQMEQIFKYIISKVVYKKQSYVHDNYNYFLDPKYFIFKNQLNNKNLFYNNNFYQYVKEKLQVQQLNQNNEPLGRKKCLINQSLLDDIITTTILQQLQNCEKDNKQNFSLTEVGNWYKQYKNTRNQIIKNVHKITLLQYYHLTRIELTCTTVDLDDKILRFLNHKTTPNLPVTKAVQMTTSFPVAFKALKWKSKWGKYYVHFSRQRLSIDIENHQMADGGILANFPIKYTDNDDLNNKYFTFSPKMSTETVGIGLDQVSNSYSESYHDSIFSELYNPQEGLGILLTIVLSKIEDYFFTYSYKFWQKSSKIVGFSLQAFSQFCKDKYNKITFNSKEGTLIPWKQLLHHLLLKIPILSFGLKMLNSLTKADRNINLQVFYQRIMTEQIEDDNWKNSKKNEVTFLNEIFYQQKYIIEPKLRNLIFKFQDRVNINNRNDFNSKNAHDFKHLRNFVKLRLSQFCLRYPIIKSQLIRRQVDKENNQNQTNNDQKIKKLSILLYLPKIFDRFKIFVFQLFDSLINRQKLLHQKIMAYLSLILEKSRNQYKKVIVCMYLFSKRKNQDGLNYFAPEQLQIIKQTHYHQLKSQITRDKINQFLTQFQRNIADINNGPVRILMQLVQSKEKQINTIGWVKAIFAEDMVSAEIITIKNHYSTILENQTYHYIVNLHNFLQQDSANQYKQFNKKCNENLSLFTQLKLQNLIYEKQNYNYTGWSEFGEKPKDKKSQQAIVLLNLLKKALTILNENHQGNENSFSFEEIQQIRSTLINYFIGQDKSYFNFGLKKYDDIRKKQRQQIVPRQQVPWNWDLRQFNLENIERYQLKYLVIHQKLKDKQKLFEGKDLQSCHKQYKNSFDIFLASLFEIKIYLNYLYQNIKLKISQNKKNKVKTEDEQKQQSAIDKIKNKLSFYINSLIDTIINNYSALLQIETNKIGKSQIETIYIIDHELLESIFREIYLKIKEKYYQALLRYNCNNEIGQFINHNNLRNQGDQVFINHRAMFIYKFIKVCFERLYYSKMVLPYFNKQIKIFQKTNAFKYITKSNNAFQIKQYTSKVLQKFEFIIDHQNNAKYQKQYQQRIFNEVKNQVENRLHKFKNFQILEIKEKFRAIAENIKNNRSFEEKYENYHQYYGFLEQLFNLHNRIKKTSFDKKNLDTHLILQGTKNCEYYLSTYLQFAIKSIRPKDQSRDFKIKAITCTNFHCLFGFMLACGMATSEIRKQLIKLQHLSSKFQKNIGKEFSSYEWLGSATQNHYIQLLKYLKQDLMKQFTEILQQKTQQLSWANRDLLESYLLKEYAQNFSIIIRKIEMYNYKSLQQILSYFKPEKHQKVKKILQLKGQKDTFDSNHLQNVDYSTKKEIQKIQEDYRSIQERYEKTFTRLLDSITETASKIDSYKVTNTDNKQSLKNKIYSIMKEYAINIKSNEEDFQNINQQIFKKQKKKFELIEQNFGSLICAILCQLIEGYSHIHFTNENFKDIVKGFFIKKLLRAYKIKQYVQQKLIKYQLDPQTTLEEFYNSMPRKIFLNFCVINTDRQRIQFLNKNNTPHMPVWAAVVAASSIPLFYQFFDVKQQWQRTTGTHFYEKVVKNFFKDTPKHTKQTSYCSSTLLTGLPLELITNKTLSKSIGDIKNYKEVVFAFNSNNSYLENINLKYSSSWNKITSFLEIITTLCSAANDILVLPGGALYMLILKGFSLLQWSKDSIGWKSLKTQPGDKYKQFKLAQQKSQNKIRNDNLTNEAQESWISGIKLKFYNFKDKITMYKNGVDNLYDPNDEHCSNIKLMALFRQFQATQRVSLKDAIIEDCIIQIPKDKTIKPSLKKQIQDKYSGKFTSGTITKNNFIKVLLTIMDANEKSIYQWYCQKLFMLPMRYSTLDNSAIFDYIITEKYGINISSPKAQQTIERSYYITKSFTQHILLSNKSTSFNCLNSMIKSQPQKNKDKYQDCKQKSKVQIRMRVSFLTKKNKEENQSGENNKQTRPTHCNYLRLDFMNHSKWNQNQKSTYLVQVRKFDKHYPNYKWQSTIQSDYIFNIEDCSKIQMRFNFPMHFSDPEKSSEIRYVQKCIDFKNVTYYFRQDPIRRFDILDYEFEFNENFELKVYNMIKTYKPYQKNFTNFQNDENLKKIEYYWNIVSKNIVQSIKFIKQNIKQKYMQHPQWYFNPIIEQQQRQLRIQNRQNEERSQYERLFIDLGVAYALTSKLDEAEQFFQRALKLNNLSSFAHFNLGLTYEEKSKSKQINLPEQQFKKYNQDAIKQYQLGINQNVDSYYCCNNLGCLYLEFLLPQSQNQQSEINTINKAIQYFKKGQLKCNNQKDKIWLFWNLSVAYQTKGVQEISKHYFNRYKNIKKQLKQNYKKQLQYIYLQNRSHSDRFFESDTPYSDILEQNNKLYKFSYRTTMKYSDHINGKKYMQNKIRSAKTQFQKIQSQSNIIFRDFCQKNFQLDQYIQKKQCLINRCCRLNRNQQKLPLIRFISKFMDKEHEYRKDLIEIKMRQAKVLEREIKNEDQKIKHERQNIKKSFHTRYFINNIKMRDIEKSKQLTNLLQREVYDKVNNEIKNRQQEIQNKVVNLLRSESQIRQSQQYSLYDQMVERFSNDIIQIIKKESQLVIQTSEKQKMNNKIINQFKNTLDNIKIQLLKDQRRKCQATQRIIQGYKKILQEKHQDYDSSQKKITILQMINKMMLLIDRTKTEQIKYTMLPINLRHHLIMFRDPKDNVNYNKKAGEKDLKDYQYGPTLILSMINQNYHRPFIDKCYNTGKFYFKQVYEQYDQQEDKKQGKLYFQNQKQLQRI